MISKLERATARHYSHIQGQCMYDYNSKLAYINIPKNASTTIKNVLNWHKRHLHKLDESQEIKTHIVVLRDPIERYISAVNMLILNSRCHLKDEHFETQSYFIENIDHNDITFFYQTDTLISDISNYFNLQLNTDIHENRGPQLFTPTAAGIEYAKEIYAIDYELINSVNFVNRK